MKSLGQILDEMNIKGLNPTVPETIPFGIPFGVEYGPEFTGDLLPPSAREFA
jgi:hypothetical protein